MIIEDQVWGSIVIEDKYLLILKSREFLRLKNKKQLGIHPSSKATHTRYDHSIGVYFLACKLVNVIKEKLSDYIVITKEDEEAIKIMALCHDIGHGPFSHLAERCLTGTHEENTVRVLTNGDGEVYHAIVDNFDIAVLNKVVDLIQLKEKVKNANQEKEVVPDLMFIISKLLSGGIDIDRLDYIARDSYNVVGKKYDFSELLDYIDLDYINDYLEITFDSEGEYLIANYLNKRFELYDLVYLDEEKFLVEKAFDKYIAKVNYPLTWETEEIDILKEMKDKIENYDLITKRYVKLVLDRNLDNNIKFRVFYNETQFNYFINKLYADFPFLSSLDDALLVTQNKINIYSSKNRIYINSNGLIKDINECHILNPNLIKEKYIFGIDFEILKFLLIKHNYENVDNIIANISQIYNSNIEEEKKYIFTSINQEEIDKYVEQIKNSFTLVGGKKVINEDLYYDDVNNILEEHRITVRNRKANNKAIWNVKTPIIDKSSITKRDEEELKSKEEVIEYLRQIIGLDLEDIKKVLLLTTNREIYDLKYKNSSFEVAIDKTLATFDDGFSFVFDMIECELKKGKAADMYFLNLIMKQFPFLIDCNESKKEIAMREYKKAKKVKILR